MTVDPRITLAALATLFMQAAGGFVWAGQASARLDAIEQRVDANPHVAERLARLEEQVADARRALSRIEQRLDQR